MSRSELMFETRMEVHFDICNGQSKHHETDDNLFIFTYFHILHNDVHIWESVYMQDNSYDVFTFIIS